MNPKEYFTLPWWLHYLLDRFAWFRRWCGGHWELWYVDMVHSDIWHNLDSCTQSGICKEFGYRPSGICRGTPLCEDYGAHRH